MSLKNSHKRRCIIQKLDFENCIITNIKTTTRRRKKLRARVTREIERCSDISEEETLINSSSSSMQTTPEPKSPVLIKRQLNRKSPVLFKRERNSPEEDVKELSEDSTVKSIPSSPVFKTFKKQKKSNFSFNASQESEKISEVVNNQDNSYTSSQSSFQIDEFTQESKQSVKISSVESTDINNLCTYSIESDSITPCQSRAPMLERSNRHERFESPKNSKRSYKKNSLLGRLQKLKQKQASEKLLWQHQNRKKSTASLKVSIVTVWKEDFNYFLKCQPTPPDLDMTFLIVDSRWVPNIKQVKEGSVVQLHPPWQILSVDGSAMKFFLNVICLDVLDETVELPIQKKATQIIAGNLFETDRDLFLNSLFSCASGLLC